MIITVTLVERTVGEVHVAIREEFAVQRTTLHVDGSCMLEAMVVVVSEIESNILEGRSTGDAGNAASRGMSERHLTISLSLDGHILWQVGQSVVACLDNFNIITCLGCIKRCLQRLVLSIANLGDVDLCRRHACHHYQQCQAEITDSLFHYY